MLASLIIVFREVIEAGLIVGIVLAATRGIARRGRFIAGGVAAGVFGAGLLAIFAGALSDALAGRGQEIFNASILALAVVMLGWHNLWMASHVAKWRASSAPWAGPSPPATSRSPPWRLSSPLRVARRRRGRAVHVRHRGVQQRGMACFAARRSARHRARCGGLFSPLPRLGGDSGAPLVLRHQLADRPGRGGLAGQAAAILAGIDLIPSWGF